MQPYWPFDKCPDCGQDVNADDEYEMDIDGENNAMIAYCCEECGLTWLRKGKIQITLSGPALDIERFNDFDYDG